MCTHRTQRRGFVVGVGYSSSRPNDRRLGGAWTSRTCTDVRAAEASVRLSGMWHETRGPCALLFLAPLARRRGRTRLAKLSSRPARRRRCSSLMMLIDLAFFSNPHTPSIGTPSGRPESGQGVRRAGWLWGSIDHTCVSVRSEIDPAVRTRPRQIGESSP